VIIDISSMARRGRGGYSPEELTQLRAGIVRNGDMSSISRDVQARVNAERDARIRQEQANIALNQARADSYSRQASQRSRVQGSQNPNSRSYREPMAPPPNYGDDYAALREILGNSGSSPRGMRTADFQISEYGGIDARDVANYENLKKQYQDKYGKSYEEVGTGKGIYLGNKKQQDKGAAFQSLLNRMARF